MASRVKEDEKNEKIIRGLLKLPANRRCINCSSLGPQYVCINFWTFVCTTCSGIHREFTHRVKSISMAKFSSHEVHALQAGGNERAREILFREWDPERHYVPDGSNIERLRDFIKHVYVDRRYTGERNTDRSSRTKMGDREDSYGDIRRLDTFRGGSRSPQHEDTPEHRFSEKNRYANDERRSPGYEQPYRRSPVRFEIVDDRVREDRFRNGRKRFEDRQYPDGASKSELQSPNHQKENDLSSPPMVRPVREILGEDAPPLRIGDPPRANGGIASDASGHAQRSASSSTSVSAEGSALEQKSATSVSLIDFSADPEPPVVAAPKNDLFSSQSVQQQPALSQSSSADNWASFGLHTEDKTQTALSNSNSLESQLLQLSATAPGPVNLISATSGVPQQLLSNTTTLQSVFSQLPASAAPPSGPVPTLPILQQQQQQLERQPSLSLASGGQSTFQQLTPPNAGVSNNQPLSVTLASSTQATPASAHPGQLSHSASRQLQAVGMVPSQPPEPPEAKPSGRKALPEDLFTATYAPAPVAFHHWRNIPPHAINPMMYGMQYPAPMMMPTFLPPSKSTNPFEINSDSVQASTFPSMAPLQGVLPNVAAPSPLLRTSSFGTPSPQWVSNQSPSYQSAVLPGAFSVQQGPSSMFPVQHGLGSFGNAGAAFGSVASGLQPATGFSHPTTPKSVGGNPFG